MEKRKTLLHDALCTLLLLGGAVAVCSVLSRVHDDNNPFAVLIFVLAVAIVALVTTGYVWGVVYGDAGGLGGHQHPYHPPEADRAPAV